MEKGKCHLRTIVPGPPRSNSGGHLGGSPQTPLEKAQAKTIAEQKRIIETNNEANKDKPGQTTDETEGVAGGGSEESTAALQKELDTCKSSLAALPDGDFAFLADTRKTLEAKKTELEDLLKNRKSPDQIRSGLLNSVKRLEADIAKKEKRILAELEEVKKAQGTVEASREQVRKLKDKLVADNAKLVQMQLQQPQLATGEGDPDPHAVAVKIFPSMADIPVDQREANQAYQKVVEGIRSGWKLEADAKESRAKVQAETAAAPNTVAQEPKPDVQVEAPKREPTQQEVAEALLAMPQETIKKVLASATAFAKAVGARTPASNQEAEGMQVDAEKRKAGLEIAAALDAGAKKVRAAAGN